MKPLLSYVLIPCLVIITTLLSPQKASAVLLDGGIDPANLGKGDWVYFVSMATNQLGGNVPSVTNIQSFMAYEKNQGMDYIIVKAGTGSTNFNGSGSSPQFNSNLVAQAHAAGLKIFAYTRSYGSDIAGEIALATYCNNLGADGFIIDAESEWESHQPWIGTNGPALAMQLAGGIKTNFPTRFLGHAPFPYITFHSSFPYKEFGYWCDAVMPQDYWHSIGVTPAQMVADMNTQWRNWQNGLTGQWTNSIKPIVPIGQADATAIPGSEITAFVNALKNDLNPVTSGGYQGVSWWRADLHTPAQWTAIAGANIGNAPGTVNDIIVDNISATTVGTWATGTSATDKYASDYRSKGQGTGTAYLQFRPSFWTAGTYQVYEWHSQGSNRTTNAPHVILHSGGTQTVFVNQKVNGGQWNLLGTYNFTEGVGGRVRIRDDFSDAGQTVIADAIKFVYVIPAPPSAPSGLSATAISSSEIDLAWTDNSSNETAFIVSRSTTSGGPYTDIAVVPANITSFSDSGLASSTTYYYVVGATNAGGASADSNQASATTQFAVSDIIIDNPSATVVGSWSSGTSAGDKFGTDYRFKSQGSGSAYLQYTPNITAAGNYEVYEWHPVGGNRTVGAPHIITYNGSATTVFVNQQNSGGQWNLLGTYNFVAGTSGNIKITDGFSDAGQIVLADAIKLVHVGGPSIPNAPSGLSATAVSSSQINLSWTDNSSDESNFIVKRSTTSGGPYSTIQTLAANTTSFNNSGLSANTTYYYVVCATNAAGASANSAQVSATTFPTAPAAPSGLSATTISAGEIDLLWTDNSGNESAFVVGRSTTSGGPYSDIISLAANTTSYDNTGLSANTTYYYVVRATNSGGSSANSAQASATTLPFPPSAPGGLNATAISSSQINLAWTDNSPNETSFTVARSTTSDGPYSDIATLAANTTSFSNTNLTAATTYYYVVRASNSGGSSPNSNQASDTTFPLVPNAPSGLSATAIRATRIDLTWTDNSANESNFIIGRSTTQGGPYTDIVTLAANTTSYNNNSGLVADTTYYYVVRATNASGASVNSNEGSATTYVTDLLVDNKSAGVAGVWSTGTSAVDKYGADYRFIGQGSGSSHLQFSPYIVTAGSFQVFEWHAQGSNRTTNAPHVITYNGGSQTVYVNQKTNGGQWNYLGTFSFAGGSAGNIKITDGFSDAGQVAMADAIQLIRVPLPAAPSGLAATAVSASQINLVWTDNATNEDNIIVARSTTSGGPYTDIATLAANTTSYNNTTGLSANTTYYYVVRASNANGSSANSAQASATTFPNTTTVNFTSVAAQDGYIQESTETSGVGGTATSNGSNTSGLRVGDDASDRQLKTIVSFDTSSLPDGAVIVSATLKIKRGAVTGTNPFTTHSTCHVDIKGGTGFGGAVALAAGDFQAAADAVQVATMSNPLANGDLSTGAINSTGRGFVNKTGTTQFRVYFATDDNDDLGNDYMGFYPGDNGTASNRPVLEIVYQ